MRTLFLVYLCACTPKVPLAPPAPLVPPAIELVEASSAMVVSPPYSVVILTREGSVWLDGLQLSGTLPASESESVTSTPEWLLDPLLHAHAGKPALKLVIAADSDVDFHALRTLIFTATVAEFDALVFATAADAGDPIGSWRGITVGRVVDWPELPVPQGEFDQALVAPAQSFRMNDAGITLNLPISWEMTRWSDWDFKAKTEDGVQLKVWTTPFQVEVTDASVAAWANMYAKEMEGEGFANVTVESKSVTTVGGRPTGKVKLTMQPKSGSPMKAVLYAMSFTGNGQVIHAYAVALARFDNEAERALNELATSLVVGKKPAAITGDTVATVAGFGATLPPGWRAPLPEEMEATREVTAKAGEDKLDPNECWVAVLPPAVGEPDVLYACKVSLYLGPVDDHSFAGVEPDVRAKFFGRVEPPVSPAEKVAVGDRTGFYFRPGGGENPVRLVVTPFGAGQVMVMWGLGRNLDAAGLDAAIQQVLPKVTFSGERE